LTVRQSFRRRGFLGGVAPSSGSRVHSCAQTERVEALQGRAVALCGDPIPFGQAE
jgi:hypothetical protein